MSETHRRAILRHQIFESNALAYEKNKYDMYWKTCSSRTLNLQKLPYPAVGGTLSPVLLLGIRDIGLRVRAADYFALRIRIQQPQPCGEGILTGRKSGPY